MRIGIPAQNTSSAPYALPGRWDGRPENPASVESVLDWARPFCGPAVLTDRLERKAAVFALSGYIPLLFPFSEWAGKKIYYDAHAGAEYDAEYCWIRWVAYRLAEEWSNARIIERATYWRTVPATKFLQVHAVSGFRVAEPVVLDGGLSLRPFEQLPHQLKLSPLFRPAFGTSSISDRCALVMEYRLSPFSGPPRDFAPRIGQPLPMELQIALAVMEVVRLARWALLLAGDGPTELAGHMTVPAEEDFPAAPDHPGISSGSFAAPPRRPSTVDVRAVPGLLLKVHYADKNRPMELALDRLGSSRLLDRDSRAIDLGIAAEIILRHKEAHAKEGDIGNRLRRRVKLLLQQSGKLGRESVATMKSLYDARSDAVHQGQISADTLAKYDEGKADRLVVSLIRKVLDNKAMPDWSVLDPPVDDTEHHLESDN